MVDAVECPQELLSCVRVLADCLLGCPEDVGQVLSVDVDLLHLDDLAKLRLGIGGGPFLESCRLDGGVDARTETDGCHAESQDEASDYETFLAFPWVCWLLSDKSAERGYAILEG